MTKGFEPKRKEYIHYKSQLAFKVDLWKTRVDFYGDYERLKEAGLITANRELTHEAQRKKRFSTAMYTSYLKELKTL